jgi:hypothetical protein
VSEVVHSCPINNLVSQQGNGPLLDVELEVRILVDLVVMVVMAVLEAMEVMGEARCIIRRPDNICGFMKKFFCSLMKLA